MGNSSLSLSSFDSKCEDKAKLPKRFVFLKHLGHGGFGKVDKCLDPKTKKIVAVKTSIYKDSLSREASMMRLLMDHNLDQKNIIKFYEESSTKNYLVFEVLDITLAEYIQKRKAPMRLQDIREVIRQLATAFDSLKNIGVIHTDLKTNNIMLVDHVRQPFKVKLIDFGLAVHKSNVKKTKIRQALSSRAPEIILGLPYSEALDIWLLGCVMAMMVFGFVLFPGKNDYELLRYMIDILGLPPDHLIDAGKRSYLFFIKTYSNQWWLKTPLEFYGYRHDSTDQRRYKFRCLDKEKAMCLEEDNIAEADERRECIELLKAMLRWDEKERITPSEILAHPFITGQYPSSSSHLSSCDEVGTSMNQAAELGTEKTQDKTPETSINQAAKPSTQETPKETQGLNSHFTTVRPAAAVMVRLPSVQIMVKPAPPENRIPLEETSDQESVREHDTLAPIIVETACSSAAAPAITLEDTNNLDDTEDDAENDTEDHKEDYKEDSERKKKRKNLIGRFVSWWKKTFFSCRSVDNVEE